MWSKGLGTPVMSATEIMAVLRSFGMAKSMCSHFISDEYYYPGASFCTVCRHLTDVPRNEG